MSRYRFSLSNPEGRQEGVIEGPDFVAAVDSLWQHVPVRRGDTLEIGVRGFPPARFECSAMTMEGQPLWLLAA
jgi:hypothetical protein